ncbi:MAG: response regulator [Lachnospiraceae bacterium]|nr:response regulator [Lachnospiraceae bacterium]
MNTNNDTLLIADDESSIREGLKYIVDWEELGFTICGEASNGEEALSRILALNPGLVLLDVKMPKLHGTEVIRRAREAGYQGKCIILSGYSDFKYAQEAISSGVSFYLTKPIDEDDLYQTVSKIKQELTEERNRSTHFTEFQSKAKSVVLKELLTNTAKSPLSAQDLDNFCLTAEIYQVVICEDFHTQAAAAPYTFAELFQVINRDNNIFDHLEINHRDVVLLKGSHGLNRLSDFLERFEEHTPQAGSPLESMFLAYGRPVSSPEDIHFSYEDATTLLTRRFFCAQEQHAMGYELLPELSSHVRTSDSADNHTGLELNETALSDYANRFVDYIQSYNRRMTVTTLSELEEALLYVSNEAHEIKLFLTDLYLQIKEKMNRAYASAKIPFSSNSSVLEFINTCNYLYEIIKFLSEQFEMIMDATGNPSRDTILDDVLYYIDHHFRDNIKLETIAPLFGYNSAYLGKIFSKTVGENFNSYVDHRRIEHSKQLLLENQLKVYEIAEQVGYKNVDYFHKKFKKYVGESPAEFRKGQGLDSETGKYPPPQKNAPKS